MCIFEYYIDTELIANIFIGIFNFLKKIDYIKLLAIIPVYVFIQRIHNQTQQRSLKSITDEIIKINDFTIEFIIKINSLKIGEIVEDKNLNDMLILKSKINSHINYLSEHLLAFPYGGPINYIYYFITKKYYSKKDKEHSEQLELEYQDAIIKDTILSLEKVFINTENQLLSIKKYENDSFNNIFNNSFKNKDDDKLILLNQSSIDTIISISSSLIAHLEENTQKCFKLA